MKMTTIRSVKKEGSESSSSLNLQKKLGSLHFFSVDRNNRWPVQGWSSGSSGDEKSFELDEQLVEECARQFTVDKAARWPLQGWCKAHKPYKSADSAVSTKPLVLSRWPQGW